MAILLVMSYYADFFCLSYLDNLVLPWRKLEGLDQNMVVCIQEELLLSLASCRAVHSFIQVFTRQLANQDPCHG